LQALDSAHQLANMTQQILELQRGFANLTDFVNGLQSSIQSLESMSPTASPSASATGSDYGYGDYGSGGPRMEAPSGWALVGGFVMLMV